MRFKPVGKETLIFSLPPFSVCNKECVARLLVKRNVMLIFK